VAAGGLRLLILDACILIDFCEADASVLTVFSRHLGAIHVAATVLDEVEQLDESQAAALGLNVVDPSLDQLTASSVKRGRLSAADHLCLVLARDNGWTCVSNDKALRTACTAEGVPVLWGLEVIALTVEAGLLSIDEAERVAWRINDSNPFITKALVASFVAKLKSKRA
jgi:rRNA-processing protein FCF1